jgi:PhzF family phenazine biosynthesis protein
MTYPLFHVDAFTDVPFAGNQAAVCLLREYPDDKWLQLVARDMNLSETAFLVPNGVDYHLRWFTPQVEVDLCGHATLASAHVLWEIAVSAAERAIRFHTRSGVLEATRSGGIIELNFPSTPPQSVAPPDGLATALGITPSYVGRSRFDHLLEVDSEKTVRSLKPDFNRLRQVSTRGVIVTSRADDARVDFVSRFFAPAVGVDEDPVTGSAHCCLGPYWQAKLGKDDLVGYQASERGGTVRVRVRGERTFLGGQAVTIARGELVVGK